MNYLYIVIFIIITMIGILSYLILTSNTSAVDIALKKANIVGTQENFEFDGVYNSSEELLSNFEDFINTYYPKINLNKINNILKNYGISLKIQDIMKNNKTTNIHKVLPVPLGLYLLLIKYDKELANLSLIGTLLYMNIITLKDPEFKKYSILNPLNPYFSYNQNYKEINELRLYFNTNNNKNKGDKLVIPNDLINTDECINNNLCYTTLDKLLEFDTNSSDLINNNYNDIENYIYMYLINDVKDRIDISNEIKTKITTDFNTINTKIKNIGFKIRI